MAKYGKLIVLAIVLLTAFYAGWSSKSPVIQQVPQIQTVYETVTHIDTAWKVKVVKETKWDTLLVEKVIIAQPETVVVTDTVKVIMTGVTTVQVGQKFGDTTKVLGQTITADTGGVYKRPWEVSYFTTGPLKSLNVEDSLPPKVDFGEFPINKTCNLGCKFKIVLVTVGLTIGIIKL